MSVSFIYSPETSVYPGCFIPSKKEEKIREKIKLDPKTIFKKPMVNIINAEKHYNIELAIPGVEREDFCIETMDNVITVMVLHNDINDKTNEFSLHEFDCKIFERKIILPKHADLSFVTANYEGGILKIHVPKSENHEQSPSSRIFVY
jgi:HSP20 family protein